MKSKPAKLEKIGQSKFFSPSWEKVQSALTRVLDEAYNPNGTMSEWVDACNVVVNEMDNLKTLGWSIRQGNTAE